MPRYEFFNHSDGSRVRVPFGKIAPASLQRALYSAHVPRISNTQELRACLRAGKFTSLGSYAVAFVMADGDTLCFDCVRNDYKEVSQALRSDSRYPDNGWKPVALAVECDSDSECVCGQCGQAIWGAKE